MTDALPTLLRKRIRWHEEDPFADWPVLSMSISVFDHRLTEVEAEESPIMFYQLAREEGAETEYLKGEKLWLDFYGELSRAGAAITIPGSQRVVQVRAESGRLKRTIIDSLRERRPMNVVFYTYPLRAIGGYDRTDHLLASTSKVRDQVAEVARRAGLFVLP